MSVIGEAFVRIAPELGGFDQLGDRVSDAVEKAGGKLSGLLGNLAKVGTVGVAGGAAAGGALLALGAQFDDVADTIRVGTGATGDALEDLNKSAKAVLKEIPTDFASVGTAIADVNTRLGITGPNLETVSKQFIELSRITGTDLAKNIEVGSQAMQNFGLSVDQQEQGLDTLFKVAQATGISFDQLASEMGRNGAVFRQAGMSFDESAALLGVLAHNGLSASDVIPGLSRAMAEAAKEGKPANEVIRDTFEAIRNAPSDTEAAAVALETFGTRGGPRMAALIREGKLGYEDLLATIGESDETILGAAEATNDWAERLTILKNRALVGLAPMAEGVFNAVTVALEAAAPVIEKVVAWLSEKLPVAVNKVSDVLGRVNWQAIFDALGRAVERVLPIVERGLDAIVKRWQSLVDWTRKHWDDISKAIERVLDFILMLWDRWGGRILSIVTTIFNQIRSRIEDAFRIIQNLFELVINIINGEWGAAWDNVLGIVRAVFDSIVGTITNSFTIIQNIIGIALDAVWMLFQAAWDLILDGLDAAFGGVIDFFAELPGRIVDALGDLGATIGNVISAAGEFVLDLIGSAVDLWVDIYIEFPGRVLSAIGDLGRTIWNHITSGLTWLWEQIVEGVENNIAFWSEFPGKVVEVLGDVGAFIWNAITSGLSALWSGVRQGIENNINFWSQFPGRVVSAIGNLGVTIWNSIRSGLSQVWVNLVGITSDWVELFREIPNRIVEAVRGFGDRVWAVIKAGWNLLARNWNSLIGGKGFSIPDIPGLPGRGKRVEVPRLPELHTGGIVPGTGEQVYRLLAGEGVFTQDQMRALAKLIAHGPGVSSANTAPISISVAIGTVRGTEAEAQRVASLTGAAVARVFTSRHLAVDARSRR